MEILSRFHLSSMAIRLVLDGGQVGLDYLKRTMEYRYVDAEIINEIDEVGSTLLHRCSAAGRIDLAKILVAVFSANIHVKDGNSRNPLLLEHATPTLDNNNFISFHIIIIMFFFWL